MATLDTRVYMTPEDHAVMTRKGPSGLPLWSFDRRTAMALADRSDSRFMVHLRDVAARHGNNIRREVTERIEWFAGTEDGESPEEIIPY